MGESRMTEDNEKSYDDNTVRDTKAGRLPFRHIKIAAYILASQLLMTAMMGVYVSGTTPQVVVFDMKGTIDLFKEQSARQSLSEETARILTGRFNAALTDSLNDWQASHNAVLLVKPAVISEQTDITAEIRADIARRMQEAR